MNFKFKLMSTLVLAVAVAGPAVSADKVDRKRAGFFTCSVLAGGNLYVTAKAIAATRGDEGFLVESFGEAVQEAYPEAGTPDVPSCTFDVDIESVNAALEKVSSGFDGIVETVEFTPDL